MNAPDLPDRKGRYPAAPEPFAGEAPSAWICRVAHAHDLTAAEIVQLQGCTASEFDAGYGETILHHIAVGAPCLTWPAPSDVVDGLREIGLTPAKPPKLSAEDWWTYCPRLPVGRRRPRDAPAFSALVSALSVDLPRACRLPAAVAKGSRNEASERTHQLRTVRRPSVES